MVGSHPLFNARTLLGLANSTSLIRSKALSKLFDERRDLDDECGYDKDISTEQYRYLFDREGLARRVVCVLPDECWEVDPEVYEDEDPEVETEFESAWKELARKVQALHFLHRADQLSGVGRFGVLLIGFDDGKSLSEQVEPGDRKVLYLRAFDESVVSVTTLDQDTNSPRYGLPTLYAITYQDLSSSGAMAGGEGVSGISQSIHWTRIIHVADNREMSEVYGAPRMRPVYNRLLDVRKVLSSSGEMFYKGGFPGFGLEMSPDASKAGATLDVDSVEEQMTDYANGLQRYIALENLAIKSLAPQVSDPRGHLEAQIEYIAITLGIPKRVLIGSEEAKLASSQDSKTWSRRVMRRQNSYVTPMLIRPLIDRLIEYGALPTPAKGDDGEPQYEVEWPDLLSPGKQEKADVAAKVTEALAKYVAGNVETMFPPAEYLTLVLGFTDQEAEQILEAAEQRVAELEEEEAERIAEMPPPAPPVPGQPQAPGQQQPPAAQPQPAAPKAGEEEDDA